MKSWAALLCFMAETMTLKPFPAAFHEGTFVFPTLSELDKVAHAAEDTQQPTVSSHLTPPCLGFLTTKWKYIPAVQASWEAQKANIHNSDRQCSSGMKNAQGRTSTRNQGDHRGVSRSRADPS